MLLRAGLILTVLTGLETVARAGAITTIDFSGATATYAAGINDAGQIVGFFVDSSSRTHALLENHGAFSQFDDGTSYTEALGINNAGLITGTTASPGHTSGFLYNGSAFTPVTDPSFVATEANGINNGGQVVGFETNTGFSGQGFLDTGGVFSPVVARVPPALSGSTTPDSLWVSTAHREALRGFWTTAEFSPRLMTLERF
jgi:probable HAF family extracellular repeat protein